MDDADTVEALTDFGLSTYAARTFIGLQKVGVASASDIAQVTEVPRSQVYGAMDELETLGLIDVQEGSPRRYRPLAPDAAKELLTARLESTAEDAFTHLQAVEGTERREADGREAIWTTDGESSITARLATLADETDERLLFATSEMRLFTDEVAAALTDATERGVTVVVASANSELRATARDCGLTTVATADDYVSELSIGRVLVADDATVLLSVLPTPEMPHIDTEAAFWSADTGFAMIIAGLVRERFA